MLRSLIILVTFLSQISLYAQSDSLELIPLRAIPTSTDNQIYTDSINSFKVIIPEWLELVTFDKAEVWGGLLPDTLGIRNAVLIKSYTKDSFASLDDFIIYVYGHVQLGQRPYWNSGFICAYKQASREYEFLGYDAFHMQLIRNEKIYYADYILVETETAYVWIDYTSTEETHYINQAKFFQFLRGFSRF